MRRRIDRREQSCSFRIRKRSICFGAALQSEPDRVTRWTYNALGQALTATEQGADGETTSTYACYADTTDTHTRGDLQSITSAAGDVTHFTAYNRHGQVLQRIAPDGSVTNNSYDAMQRLLGSTVDGEGVSFSYDPIGQLTRSSDDDGGWVGYAYDDAHRRTAAFNQASLDVHRSRRAAHRGRVQAGIHRRLRLWSVDEWTVGIPGGSIVHPTLRRKPG